MFIKITKIGVSKNGKDIPIGQTVETDDNSAKSLIASGYAEAAEDQGENNAQNGPVGDETGADDKKVDEGAENGSQAPGNEPGGANNENPDGQDEELVKVKKALDTQYKRDEIYDAAIKAGVEIAYDAKKAEIVDAVVAQGKAEALLK